MSDFLAHPWLQRPHLQTIGGSFLRELWIKRYPAKIQRRLLVPSSYHDRLSVWQLGDADNAPTIDSAQAPVLFLHGIAGSAESAQIQTNASLVRHKLGAQTWALNFRGADQRFEIPRLYHAGCSEDLQLVVQALAEQCGQPIFVVGYSLGGNVLLKWLGEQGQQAQQWVRAACALSVPFELGRCAELLEESWVTRIYRKQFVGHLQGRTLELLRYFPDCLVPESIKGTRTLRDFDSQVTAKLHGFHSVDHYYQECSSSRYLEGIGVPTLVVHAQDDPFYPISLQRLPHWMPENRLLKFEFPAHGGHLGFIGHTERFWYENRIVRYFGQREFLSQAAKSESA